MRIAQRRALWVERLLKAKAMLHVREGNGTPLQSSCLENPMDRGAWWAAVCGVEKSRTRLSDFTFTFCFHELEKEMATHSSVLAWRIPGVGEPGGLPSMGLHSRTQLRQLSSSSSSSIHLSIKKRTNFWLSSKLSDPIKISSFSGHFPLITFTCSQPLLYT